MSISAHPDGTERIEPHLGEGVPRAPEPAIKKADQREEAEKDLADVATGKKTLYLGPSNPPTAVEKREHDVAVIQKHLSETLTKDAKTGDSLWVGLGELIAKIAAFIRDLLLAIFGRGDTSKPKSIATMPLAPGKPPVRPVLPNGTISTPSTKQTTGSDENSGFSSSDDIYEEGEHRDNGNLAASHHQQEAEDIDFTDMPHDVKALGMPLYLLGNDAEDKKIVEAILLLETACKEQMNDPVANHKLNEYAQTGDIDGASAFLKSRVTSHIQKQLHEATAKISTELYTVIETVTKKPEMSVALANMLVSKFPILDFEGLIEVGMTDDLSAPIAEFLQQHTHEIEGLTALKGALGHASNLLEGMFDQLHDQDRSKLAEYLHPKLLYSKTAIVTEVPAGNLNENNDLFKTPRQKGNG